MYNTLTVYLLWVSFWKVLSHGELTSSITNEPYNNKSMKKKAVLNNTPVCQVRIQSISDAMSILSGKWKFHILGTLIEGNKLGFMDLLREVDGIGTNTNSYLILL